MAFRLFAIDDSQICQQTITSLAYSPVHQVEEENYQRKFLRVWLKVIGLVDNTELSWVQSKVWDKSKVSFDEPIFVRK